MSTDAPRLVLRAAHAAAPPCRSLAQYIRLLIARLDEKEPAAATRIRTLVGRRRARIALDDETVIVGFSATDGRLMVGDDDGQPVAGSGVTDRATVLALLDGYASVTDVILDGRLRVDGPVDDIARMFQSIETLIDGATRVPMLQQLARDFRGDPCRAPGSGRRGRGASQSRSQVSPGSVGAGEMALLERLGLLPPGA
jgi:hypothetical protein